MQIKLVGSTNRIKKLQTAKRFVQNHARECYSEKSWDELIGEDFQSGLVKSLITRGHHSPFDHFQLNFEIRQLPKILAMVLNYQGVYTTSEKSARYTVMSDINPHQKELYDKWKDWYLDEISSRFPESTFSKLHKRGSDGKTPAEKLSQENARYVTSVFTPTNMTHTVSLRQANILYHFFNDFIEEHNDSSNEFKKRLTEPMKEFVNSEEIQKWIIKEAQVKMKGGIPLRFIRDSEVEEHFGEDIYSTNYDASFASFAQLQRHRLSVYDISGGFEIGASKGFYVPHLIKDSSKENEWLSDLESVSQYDFPQAQLLRVGERGMRENFPAKSIERLCGLAQLETAKIVSDVGQKYSEYIPEMEKYAKPACEVEEGCKKGGCIFGKENYLSRLI